jgi:hypothetical protein
MSSQAGSFRAVPLPSLAPRDATDATESAAHILEGIVIKNS